MFELKITPKDWISVFSTGTLFSAFLSMLAYYLLGMKLIEGAIFGIVLGSFIAFYSFAFITTMNRRLLPNLSKQWWNPIATMFSFSSGFLGTLSTYLVCRFLPVSTVELFSSHPFPTASIIGVLTYLMGSLMYRFVKARNEKEEKERLFVQSRLSSLETQLNPHFLFNALNSLSELVHQNPLKAEEMIVKLSHFLRNTMGEKALIPLSEELRNVRDYVELETIRFPRLHIDITADPETLAIPIPKFSIQLLVENAIKHGMKNSPDQFTITVSASWDNPLSVRVANNGTGVENPSFGIGLSNLQERLNYLCQGDVTLESSDPVIYTITLKACHETIDR